MMETIFHLGGSRSSDLRKGVDERDRKGKSKDISSERPSVLRQKALLIALWSFSQLGHEVMMFPCCDDLARGV